MSRAHLTRTLFKCVAGPTAFFLGLGLVGWANAGLGGAQAQDAAPWMNKSLPPGKRAALLVAAMTLDEKIAQLHGAMGGPPEIPECGVKNIRQVPAIARLQIPTFRI